MSMLESESASASLGPYGAEDGRRVLGPAFHHRSTDVSGLKLSVSGPFSLIINNCDSDAGLNLLLQSHFTLCIIEEPRSIVAVCIGMTRIILSSANMLLSVEFTSFSFKILCQRLR